MNPIPYQNLMDIDGLKMAIKDAEKTSDEFGNAATEDFKRAKGAAAALRKELEGINAAISGKTIKLTDPSGQAEVQAFAQQVANLTKMFKDQQAAIANINRVLQSNKQAISDAKTEEAQYRAQLAKGKSDQQQVTVAIANTTLQMKQLALANKQGAQAITAASGSYKEAQQRLTALGNAIKNAEGGFNSTSPALKAQIKEYNELNDQLKKFDAQMGNHQRNVGNYTGAIGEYVNGLKGYIEGLVGFAAAVELVKKTFDAAIETDATRTSLGYILESTTLADEKLNTLKQTANRLGLEFTSTAKAYALFIGAAKASNFSLQEADKVFNSVSRVVGVLHLSSDQAHNAFYALQEMISKGTIQSKELQRQLGQAIPGAVKIMADAIGVSVNKLHDMEKSGELLTSDVLPKFADQLDKAIAPGVDKIDSLQASWNNLKNTFTETVDAETNIGKFFKGIIDGVNELLKAISGITQSKSWIEFFSRIATIGTYGVAGKYDRRNQFTSAMEDVNKIQGDYYNQVDKNAGGLNDFSLEDLKSNLEKLTSARGAAIDAYAKFKAGVLLGKTSEEHPGQLNEADETINKLNTSIGLLTERYNKLSAAQKKNAEIADEDLKSIDEIRKRITELNKLPGSAIKGDPIEQRIERLKARLKELTDHAKAAKDGFQVLQDQINKMLLKLQDSIIEDYTKHQGKQTTQTLKLADAYERLVARLNDYKKAQEEAILESNRQHNIRTFGSVYPGAKVSDNVPVLSAKEQNNLAISDNNSAIEQNDISLNQVIEKYNTENNAIIALYEKRVIAKEEMDRRLTNSAKLQANEEYQINLKNVNLQLDNAARMYGIDSKQYSDLLVKKSNLTKAFEEGRLKEFLAELEKERKKLEDFYKSLEDTIGKGADIVGKATGSQGVSSLLSDVGNGISKLSLSNQTGEDPVTNAQKFQMGAQIAIDATQAYTDFAIKASEQRQAALEREMQYEIQGAGTNKEARLRIEAEYNKKILDEKRKQAKAQKAAAAIEIIMNTAIAISKTLAETGLFGTPLVPVIAALGAAELAIVLAQPLPQYAKGREDGPAQFAEVNERGPEALVKGNRVRFANKGKRGVTYLEKGEKVITADKTTQMLNKQIAYQTESADNVSQSRVIYDRYISTSTQNSNIDYDRMSAAVQDGMSKLPLEQNIMDERGFSRFIVTKNARIKAVRDRNKL